MSFAARIKDPKSGRIMEVFTTEPGLQVYTDNGANGYKGQMGLLFLVVVLFVLRHNTFQILLIALISFCYFGAM